MRGALCKLLLRHVVALSVHLCLRKSARRSPRVLRTCCFMQVALRNFCARDILRKLLFVSAPRKLLSRKCSAQFALYKSARRSPRVLRASFSAQVAVLRLNALCVLLTYSNVTIFSSRSCGNRLRILLFGTSAHPAEIEPAIRDDESSRANHETASKDQLAHGTRARAIRDARALPSDVNRADPRRGSQSRTANLRYPSSLLYPDPLRRRFTPRQNPH